MIEIILGIYSFLALVFKFTLDFFIGTFLPKDSPKNQKIKYSLITFSLCLIWPLSGLLIAGYVVIDMRSYKKGKTNERKDSTSHSD